MLYPVILSGGFGQRLWPASRPSRPKPFIPLIDGRSTFAMAMERALRLPDVARPTVVAGLGHEQAVRTAVDALGAEVVLLLEPAARDSAAAMAAAAHWIVDQDPEGVVLFLAADHHIPDQNAFRDTIARALPFAARGEIVTLGVTPTQPATGYGYIRRGEPLDDGLWRVARFVEKPRLDQARTLLAEGCLWNSGMFMVSAAGLIAELDAYAPAVAAASRAAVDEAVTDGAVVRLGESFLTAPKISIDYAVMEHTQRAVVASAPFAWSDLGSWGAVRETEASDARGNVVSGAAVLEGASNTLVRAGPGALVVAVGTRNLAIIVDDGVVMVCSLDDDAGLKAAVDRAQAISAQGPNPCGPVGRVA